MEELFFVRRSESGELCRFYEEVCAAQAGDPAGPNWHYGIYPAPEDIEERIADDALFCLRRDGRVAVAGVLRAGEDPEYRNAPWKITREPVGVLHLFAVHPDYRGRGLAKAALRALLALCEERGFRALHLDVMLGNRAAEQLYQSLGFAFRSECTVWYEDTGESTVRLYEYEFDGAESGE